MFTDREYLRKAQAACGETRLSGVRREAFGSIPDVVRKNSEEGSWVNGLPGSESRWWTRACH